MMMRRLLFILVMLTMTGSALADTAYITDTVTVAIYPNADLKGEPVERLLSNSLVDVLQRGSGVAQVKTSSGKIGWLRTDFLTTNLPAAIKLENAQHELNKANTELKSAKEKIAVLEKETDTAKTDANKNVGWMKAEMEKARKKAAEFERQLKSGEAQATEVKQQSGALEEQMATLKAEKEDMEKRLAAAMLIDQEGAPESSDSSAQESNILWSLVLLPVGFVLGFGAGYYWLDRRVRRRFGGARVY
jgi:SH3 domain protein